MIGQDAQIYLTEADPDGDLAPDTRDPRECIDELRAYLIRHALLRGPMIVGDSQINNNPHLRRLLWPHDEPLADSDPPLPVPEELRDLSQLLEEGHLVPVLRGSAASLTELHAAQRDRGVAGLPPREYVEFLDRKRLDYGRRFDLEFVGRQFRRLVLAYFSPVNELCALTGEKRARVREWIEDQPELYFDALRAWAEAQVQDGNFTRHDLDVINAAAAVQYRHNVPNALGLAPDIRHSKRLRWGVADVPLGRSNNTVGGAETQVQQVQRYEIPPIVLSTRLLVRMPSRLVTYVKNESPHLELLAALRAYESQGSPTGDHLADVFTNFADLLNDVLRAEAPARFRKGLSAETTDTGSRTYLHVESGPSLGRFTIWRATAEQPGRAADGFGYGSAVHGSTRTAMASSERHGIAEGYLVAELPSVEGTVPETSLGVDDPSVR